MSTKKNFEKRHKNKNKNKYRHLNLQGDGLDEFSFEFANLNKKLSKSFDKISEEMN